MSVFADAALNYAARGWAVFPVRPGDKKPFVGSHGCSEATIDPERIKEWWSRAPEANVGVATGRISGVYVVDVDRKNGGVGNFEKLCAAAGGLEPTLLSITGSGGWHLWYEYDPNGPVSGTAGRIAPGVDTRGNGNYVVAPPSLTSPAVHPPAGGKYYWHDPEAPIGRLPEWIAERLRAPAIRSGRPKANDPDFFLQLFRGVRHGARNDSATRIVGYLLRRKVDPFIVLEILKMWNGRLPEPLSEREIVSTFDNVCKTDLARRTRSVRK